MRLMLLGKQQRGQQEALDRAHASGCADDADVDPFVLRAVEAAVSCGRHLRMVYQSSRACVGCSPEPLPALISGS